MRIPYHRERQLFCQPADHKFSLDLQAMAGLLEKHPEFIEWVHCDIMAGKSLKGTGAKGMTSEQILRAAIIKQMNGWTYEFLEIQCVDSEMTRAFIKLGFGETYSDSCLQENIAKIRGETWQKITDSLIRYAADKGVEKGRTVRMDATVVEGNIHEPSDSSLLYDVIRTAQGIFKKMRKSLGIKVFGSTSAKDAKVLVLKIMNAGDKEKRKLHYKKLIKDTSGMLDRIQLAMTKLGKEDDLYRQLTHLADIAPQVISQTKRRVMRGEKVPSEEKVVSIFEHHTDIIVKGKREVEYGHKVFFTSEMTFETEHTPQI